MIRKLNDLKQKLEGDLFYDNLMQVLYATDASVYRELPLAVALPKNSNDIVKLVQFASKNNTSLIPRAGGTSLAGQCVGNGIVVDISKYMNQVLEINPHEKWVRVQPGVVRDQLNVLLKPYNLYFGPNTSTSNRCNIGGMVGNNSCGTTSIVYGSTREHVLELRTVLSDGSEAEFNAVTKLEFDNKKEGNSLEAKLYQQIAELLTNDDNQDEIKNNFPKASVSRRNTGYALDTLMNTEVFSDSNERFNFCKLLCGSEGTLAFTTEVKLNLVPIPKPNDVVLAAHFDSINESMRATVLAMSHNPTACELMDKTILDCTKGQIEYKKHRFFIEGDPQAVLLIEFRENTLEEAHAKAKALAAYLVENKLGYALPIISGNQTDSVWNLRKAGLGLLANIPGDKKAVACIEDTAVAIEDLPEYIEEFSNMMKNYNQDAVYYAHAGAGELHLRPILDLKNSKDVKDFRCISKSSAELVKKYNGSLSGEHGDGRVRAEFIPLVLGERNYQFFYDIKNTWDSEGVFNPGKIVDAKPMESDLRYEADVATPEFSTAFNFSETGGILRTVEKCNGSGDCRKLNFAGGTMCPSYRATMDEKDTTRGRANVLREFLTKSTKDNPFDHPEIKEAMDLCISCKGCKSECPSNIDMATLKAEFQYQYNKDHKPSWRTKLIAKNAVLNGRLSKFSRIHNFLANQRWFKILVGVHIERSIPQLSQTTLRTWIEKYEQTSMKKKVYLFCDEYTNYYDVFVGIKAVKLLNRLGYEVLTINHEESGRALISKGFLDQAKLVANKNIDHFCNVVTEKIPLIGIEPSAILSFRDEYPNLVDETKKQKALELQKHVYLIDEFLSKELEKGNIDKAIFKRNEKQILIHGHCHQKALSSQKFTISLMKLVSNSVETIPSGCCGMAGSFGYEKEHYNLSMKIGGQVLFPTINDRIDETLIVASGTSCRHQIKDGTSQLAYHPVEVLCNAID